MRGETDRQGQSQGERRRPRERQEATLDTADRPGGNWHAVSPESPIDEEQLECTERKPETNRRGRNHHSGPDSTDT